MRFARPVIFFFEVIAVGAGSLLLGGIAYADVTPKAAENGAAAISANSDAIILVSEQAKTETLSSQDVTLSQLGSSAPLVITPASVQPGPAIGEVKLSKTNDPLPTSQEPLSGSIATNATTETASTVSAPNDVTAASGLPLTTPAPTITFSTPATPISLRSNLVSMPLSYMASPFSSEMDNTDKAYNTPVTTSGSTPEVPTPKSPTPAPFGMVGAILSLFDQALPSYYPNPVGPVSTGFVGLIVVLTMVAWAVASTVRTTVVSYGTWLKQIGFTSAGRSGLPAPIFSFFVTPRLMGYVCAPAPFS